MSRMIFTPWEKVINNVKLVPKMMFLTVFIVITLAGKQFWDAHTFRQSVLELLQVQSHTLAMRNVALSKTLLALPDGVALLERAVISENQIGTGEKYIFLVNTKSGEILAHPRFSAISDLNLPLQNGRLLSEQMRNSDAEFTYHLRNEARHGIVVPVPGSTWLVAASQPNSVAEQYYQTYLLESAWQTGVIILLLILMLLGNSRLMLRQISYLTDCIRLMSRKDLSQSVIMECNDEFGELADELEKTRIQLSNVLTAQRGSSEKLTNIAQEMNVCMSETMESAKEQFGEVDQLASAMSEMSSTVQDVAGHARAASQATESTRQQAIKGQGYVSETIDTIHKLSEDMRLSSSAVNQVEERVDKISSVVVTIQGISEQTNLLALNAAIEAARAGEAGRGFAVVADEVRNLAQNTQKSTVEIQKMISQLQSSAQQAVSLMEKSVGEAEGSVDSVGKAGEELNLIVEQMEQINDMNFHIASAAEQQALVADEMNSNLTNVRELVQASLTVFAELSETADQIEENATMLDSKIKEFAV